MNNRALLMAAPLVVLLASPATAQSRGDDRDAREFQTEAVDKLNDPEFQANMADMMGGMMQAIMSMKIGPLAKAASRMDPDGSMADVPVDATVGDVASRGDPHYAERMEGDTRRMTRSMGVMASGMAKMMPVMIDMARDMGAQMEKSMGREMRKIERDVDKDLD